MGPEDQPESALISPLRLAEIVAEVDGQDPMRLEALLIALMSAAWPTNYAVDQ